MRLADKKAELLKIKELKHLIVWHRGKKEYVQADQMKAELNRIYAARRTPKVNKQNGKS